MTIVREAVIKDKFGTQQNALYTKGLFDAMNTFDFDKKRSILESRCNEIVVLTTYAGTQSVNYTNCTQV